MMSVSIIHAPRDEALGEKIAAALASAGHASRRVSPDPNLGDLQLETETVVEDDDETAIVVWTEAAAKLARLHQQAGAAMARGTLIPVAVGGVRPPGGFEDLPPVDLSGWTGAPDDPRWRFVLEEIQLAKERTLLKDGEVWAAPDNDEGDAAPEEAALYARPFVEKDAEPETMDAPPAFLARPQRSGLARRFSAREVAIGATAGLVVMTLATAFLAPLVLPGIERRLSNAIDGGVEPDRSAAAAGDPSPDAATNLASLRPVQTEGAPSTDEEVSLTPGLPEEEDAIAALIDSEAADANEETTPTFPAAANETPLAMEDGAGDDGAPAETAIAESVETGSGQTQTAALDSEGMERLIASVSDEVQGEDGTEENASAPDAAAQATGEDGFFRDCVDCPQMARLPAGRFRMGAGQGARDPAESPARDVTIANPFAIGVHEITYEDWAPCVEAGVCPAAPEHGWGGGRRPVVSVSYEDAQTYVGWLSTVTGEAYRLPSEAEWEYAARAGSDSAFAFGPTISVDQANFNGQYPYGGGKGVFRERTTEVASFPPNAFGLYDMHGNAWEWTSDCWNPTHAGAPGDGSAVATGDCTKHVLKGGAWNTGGWRLRSAHRIGKASTKREFDNGFRIARDL
ncbi:formylglycine-generating enzyme family protein [Hyphococcus luteus]|uniref:Sulfatase-modifying factor enzyme-like domain-containing protein n=1 Tax=Hyphococcus luteus TaxID=2058213 RepID=A0A2S7K6U6_9PROT|nr:SUMF1/EgtB/PvdO family nonheme iron enzyme [Marinicaulis flavus]PQA88212.1 hypothetical protein CW354_07860 [Marinicaulis flavus]